MKISRVPQGTSLIKMPDILITPTAYETLLHFIDAYPNEISGPGRVEKREIVTPNLISGAVDVQTIMVIYDIFGVESFNLSAHTDAKDGFQKLYAQMIQQNQPTESIRLWWHSHVDFGADWSSEDDGTIFNFDCDYMISIVGNKLQEFKVRLDVYDPVRVSINNIPFPKFYVSAESPIRKVVEEQIKKYAKPDNFVSRGASKLFGRGKP